MKNKMKLLLFILIVPFMCINVNAKEITKEEYMDIFSMSVPEKIQLDETYEYYLDNAYAREITYQNTRDSILASINAYMAENDLEYTFDGVLNVTSSNIDNTKFMCALYENGTKLRDSYGDVVYKDIENYSAEDEKEIDEIISNTTLYHKYELDPSESSLLNNQNALRERYPLYSSIDEAIKDTEITYRSSHEVVERFDAFNVLMNARIYLFKNGVFYKSTFVANEITVIVNVPDEVEKTIDAYSEYTEEKVKEILGDVKEEETVEAIQSTPSETTTADNYGIFINDNYHGTIPVVNNDKVLLTDNFEVDKETANNYVYATQIVEEEPTSNYTSMKNFLSENGFTNIVRAYNIIGNNTSRAYFYFDNTFNGKTLRILGIKDGSYLTQDAVVENGMIIANIYMKDELIIAEKQEQEETPVEETITFTDISNSVSGYYSSEYTENEVQNIKNEIEKTIVEEINEKGIDYKSEGYTVSLEKSEEWYLNITNKKGETYKKTIYITPKKTVVEDTSYTPKAPVATQTRPQQVRRYYPVKYTENIETPVEEKTEEVEETKEEENTLKPIEKVERTKPAQEETKKEVKETPKEVKEVKKVNTLPIKIIIGSVIILIIGGGVYYVRSRYY